MIEQLTKALFAFGATISFSVTGAFAQTVEDTTKNSIVAAEMARKHFTITVDATSSNAAKDKMHIISFPRLQCFGETQDQASGKIHKTLNKYPAPHYQPQNSELDHNSPTIIEITELAFWNAFVRDYVANGKLERVLFARSCPDDDHKFGMVVQIVNSARKLLIEHFFDIDQFDGRSIVDKLSIEYTPLAFLKPSPEGQVSNQVNKQKNSKKPR